MKKKYLSLLLFVGCLYACSSDSPEPPAPHPDEEEKDPKPDPEERPEPEKPVTAYVFPQDFSDDLLGKEVTIKNDLVVVRTYGDKLEGNVTLASSLLRIPTEVEQPGSEEYRKLMEANQLSKLTLAPSGITLLDPAYQTLRVGTKLSKVKGKVSKDKNHYLLTLTESPQFDHVKRPTFVEEQTRNIQGKYVNSSVLKYTEDIAARNSELSVVSMNLEYYMASPSMWGHSNGARDKDAFNRQNQKIIAAMKEMKADIFAICEIEEGNYSPAYLTEQLNQALGTTAYKYIDTGDDKITSYTKNTFIYNSEAVKPYKDCKHYDADYLQLRHIIQCFEQNNSGERFILSLNHFKAKSGKASGHNVDQHDGQGAFNARRVEEATNCLTTLQTLQEYYGDTDLMVVGDLNSYSKEDPIRVFTDGGFVDELMKYASESWSYVYDGQVGYLDHILCSPSMSKQVLKAFTWDVNASEPSALGYEIINNFVPNAYRYSDHNPVIAVIDLK